MTRSFAAALVATATLAFPPQHASAQGVTQDVKTAASGVGNTASKVGKGTAHVAVKAADATAGEGKKVGTYVKHRFTRHRRPAAKRRTATPDSAGR